MKNNQTKNEIKSNVSNSDEIKNIFWCNHMQPGLLYPEYNAQPDIKNQLQNHNQTLNNNKLQNTTNEHPSANHHNSSQNTQKILQTQNDNNLQSQKISHNQKTRIVAPTKLNVHDNINVTKSQMIPPVEFVEADNLADLRTNISKVNLDFKKYANTMVFSDGDSESSVMFIGEAPGQIEDREGKPFVGESGQLLEEILNAANIYRRNYYITNVIPWRPPSNRTPTVEEINFMKPYVLNHIKIINPKIVVLIGGVACRAILNQVKAITTIRGQFIEQNDRLYYPIFHPSYLLRSPSKKKEMWHDVLTLRHKILKIDPDFFG